MKKIIIHSALAAICIFASGCASIVSGGHKTVQISSNPTGAKFVIYDKEGNPVFTQTTPASVKLKSSHGYFDGEKYKLVFNAPGYYPGETYIQSKINGWYFGNVVFGGLIGLVLVDPATGAMWTLSPKTLNYNLISSEETLTPDELKIAELKANPVQEATSVVTSHSKK